MAKDLSDPSSLAGKSEHSQQCALMSAAAQYRESGLRWLHAIPNGGARGSDQRSAMIAGAMLKAEGVKAGVADCCLPIARRGWHGLYIEMKAPGKARIPNRGQSPEQIEFEAHCIAENYLYALFDSWEDAWLALAWYLELPAQRDWDKALREKRASESAWSA